MNCPNDGTLLQMTSRENIEIDYCPQCRGVWLDRGELDKLIERSAAAAPPPQQRPADLSRTQEDVYRHHDADDTHKYHQNQYHKKKRESFLGDIFDF